MSVQAYRIAFLQTVKEQLFANSDFINASESHDGYASDNKTVKVPQAGTTPDITLNRSVWPMMAEERQDDTLSYDLIKFDTGLIKIQDIEDMWLSYDKRASVLRSYTDKLNQQIGDRAMYQWAEDFVADSKTFIPTSGTLYAAAGIGPNGTTGNRRGLTLNDLAAAKGKISADNLNVTGGKLHCLVPAQVWQRFLQDNPTSLSSFYMGSPNLLTGSVAKVLDINIYERSYTQTYTNAATPIRNATGAAVAVTDVYGILVWHQDCVARAKTPINLFLETQRADYQGAIMSADIMFEAVKSRSDYKGVSTIVQASA